MAARRLSLMRPRSSTPRHFTRILSPTLQTSSTERTRLLESSEMRVKCLGVDDRGRIKLSRRAAMEEADAED